ncbi:MAG: plastocyanin/azurin family copper-binding protein [Phyllobacterium sp.]
MMDRRQFLMVGGGLFASLSGGIPLAMADDPVEIGMQGRTDGSHVWFDPVGLLVRPGQTIRWTNRDPGNSHSATAYHPDNFDRPQRIPKGAMAWNSDLLLPDESFSVTLTVPGVYDYYCLPHEHAGMVGRIIVANGAAEAEAFVGYADQEAGDIPEIALKAFPSIGDIIRQETVRKA